MSWLNKCFHRYFSQYLSLYEVFKVHKSDTQFYVSDRMEMERFELLTPCLQGRCSPNWATPPFGIYLIFCFLIWQPPAFPYRHQYSIIGRFRLNHRVRDVDGCFPKAHRHQNMRIKFCGTKFTNLCGKLAFLSGFVNFCISGTPATERTCSRGFAKRSCLITGQWIISTWFP